MKREEEKLVSNDLLSRIELKATTKVLKEEAGEISVIELDSSLIDKIKDLNIRPILRSKLKDMTSEEANTFNQMLHLEAEDKLSDEKVKEWLILNHFDYYNLIPLGLAVRASENFYNN